MPAFIVDGLTEKKIVQRLCKDTVVRTLTLNGKNVALGAIAKAAFSLIKLFKGRHYPIILVVDREGRPDFSEQIEAELKRLLVELGVPEGDIIVSCPDRMIENWMLGDGRYFEEIYDIRLTQSYEGTNGKSEIRKLLSVKKVSYHEIAVGVELFCGIDPRRVAASVQSFRRFQTKVGPFCPWLRSAWSQPTPTP